MLNSKLIYYINLLIILTLLFAIFPTIKIVKSFTTIKTEENFTLVPGNEYRFQKYSKDLRIYYSSSALNDLFLPLKTETEWTAFLIIIPALLN